MAPGSGEFNGARASGPGRDLALAELAVEVEVPWRALLEPQAIVVGRVL